MVLNFFSAIFQGSYLSIAIFHGNVDIFIIFKEAVEFYDVGMS